MLIPNGPFTDLAGRILSLVLICYLFSARVRTAFRAPQTSRWWGYAAAGLGVASLIYTLWESQPEMKAILWHWHHGNEITVNGVKFPVYTWYAPEQANPSTGFAILDRPGPLRSRDRFTAITVESNSEETLTPDQLVEKEFQSYQKAGYKDLRKFQIQLRGEPMECMENTLYGNAIFCYGNGPIRHVFFAGGEASLERFHSMIAEAR